VNTSTTSGIPYVTEQTFERDVLSSELPVLLEFSATWCAPCKQVEPDLIALRHELEGKAKVFKIDVDKSPMLAQELQIKSVPTFMVVHQGRVVGGQPGAIRRAQMRQMIEPFLPRSESALPVEELIKLLQAQRVVPVDTRDAGSFARAHIPGAVHIPLAEVPDRIMEAMSTGRAPVIYCRSGLETKELAEKMAEDGFPVGFLAWEVSGTGIERG
jgi:thioredoxin 1/putative thioredoxin